MQRYIIIPMLFFGSKNQLIVLFFLSVILLFPRAVAAQHNATVRVPILIYHHVGELQDTASDAQRRWTIVPKIFEEHVRWFAEHGFHTITMTQLTVHLKRKEALPFKAVVLSFDDGWIDHYTTVVPILKKYNFTGTFFVTVDSVGHSAFVSWEQLQEMSQAGMDIQAHSMTHPHLVQLSPQEAFREIIESKKVIERHLNNPVVVFAYPFGSYNHDVLQMVKRAGFESAVTVQGMNHGYVTDHLYTLSRYAVTGDDTVLDLARETSQ